MLIFRPGKRGMRSSVLPSSSNVFYTSSRTFSCLKVSAAPWTWLTNSDWRLRRCIYHFATAVSQCYPFHEQCLTKCRAIKFSPELSSAFNLVGDFAGGAGCAIILWLHKRYHWKVKWILFVSAIFSIFP